jgi:hypothetical protein
LEAIHMAAHAYPVHVDARLDDHLSRWQWLVKWLLVIPHYVVLAFLWLAFVVLSVVAFFAILFTGRYPRAIFEFNVGVLRWSWRVAYYAYGALGTDHYPPFTLQERPDYPAHLEVDYPEHLSRGLVLVKWWLLAIPHYLLVGLFLGGAGWAVGEAANTDDTNGTIGLITLLVVFAGFALLFTGRYPQSVFDFVLGLNRWVLRVAGYAALMTDQYPPFRLDQGGSEGPTATLTAPPAPGTQDRQPGTAGPPPGPPAPVPPAPGGHRWTAGRIASVIVGSMLVLGSLGLGAAGATLAFADNELRDDAGFLMTDDTAFSTSGYALASEVLEVHADAPAAFMPDALLGEAKIEAESDTPVFVGVAPAADVDRYLADVGHSVVVDFTDRPVYDNVTGGAPATPPGEADFWVAQSSGTGTQEVTWEVENGDWTVVVMNADGSASVDADLAVGAEVPALEVLVWTLLVAAVVVLVLGLVLVLLPVVLASKEPRS